MRIIGESVLCLVMSSTALVQAQQYVVSTYAGGTPPPTPLPGANLAIWYPQGLATDAAGNAYFAMLNCVFRLGPDDIVDRIAGNCRPGYSGDGGAARDAQFRLGIGYLNPPPYVGTELPLGIAVDNAGDIFVADTGNYRIRRISPEGIVSTVAGNGTKGFSGDGGPAIKAQLSDVVGISVNAGGDLFIADFGNHRVRVVKPDGVIGTLAGDGTCGKSGDGGPAAAAELCYPAGLATASSGDLFIADMGNNRIRQIVPDGTITTVVGCVTATRSDGVCGGWVDGVQAMEAPLVMPTNVAVDGGGNLFIADTVWDAASEVSWQAVRKVGRDGVAATVAGGACAAFQELPCRFSSQVFDGTTANRTFLAGPLSLAIRGDGSLLIADGSTKEFNVFPGGAIVTVAGNSGSVSFAGDGGPAANAQLLDPTSLTIDDSGDLFIHDSWNWRVRKVSPDGTIGTAAGNSTCCSSSKGPGTAIGDGGPATSAPLCGALSLAADQAGDLFIADLCSGRVREVTSDGIINSVAGGGNVYRGASSGDDGPALDAGLWILESVAADRAGNLFIG